MRPQLRVIVIGGGIGGIAAGLALRRVGAHVEVFERAPVLKEIGAGLSLWPNALRALDAIGLGDTIRRAGLPDVHAGLRTWRGEVLTGQQFTRESAVCVMHRADVLDVLADGFGRSHLCMGAECVGVDEDATGVAARFRDGRRVRADALIGADGLHSVVRAHLHGDHEPTYAGYTAWRSVVRFDHARLAAGETLGAGLRFGHLPMSQGRVYWYCAKTEPERARTQGGEKAALLRHLNGWHAPIEDLVEASVESEILRNDIYDRPPLSHWSHGRVTLVGDAAHPMTPNLGQGACQALEDAVVLASCLRQAHGGSSIGSDDVAAALARYESRRIARANWIVAQSRQIGRVFQWRNPVATAMRDTVIKYLGPSLQPRTIAKVMKFDAPDLGDGSSLR